MTARRRSDFTACGRENSFRGCWSTAPCPRVRARRAALPKPRATVEPVNNRRLPRCAYACQSPLLAVVDALIVPPLLPTTKQLAFGKLTIKAVRCPRLVRDPLRGCLIGFTPPLTLRGSIASDDERHGTPVVRRIVRATELKNPLIAILPPGLELLPRTNDEPGNVATGNRHLKASNAI